MVERLGNVLYWAGCVGSVGAAGFFISLLVSSRDPALGIHLGWDVWIFYGVLPTVGFWAVGRALRYILAGR